MQSVEDLRTVCFMAYGNGLDIDSLLMWLMKQTASHVIALKLFLVLAILYFIYIIILARDVAVNKTKMLIFDGFFACIIIKPKCPL